MVGYDFQSAKVVIVTGGGSGIGRALCLSVAARGVQTVVAADIDLPGAEETVREIQDLGSGCQAKALYADVSTRQGVVALIDDVERAHGPVDAFFANAGISGGFGTIDADSTEVWDRMMAIHVYQTVHAAKRLLPGLARRRGCIAVTSSAAGLLTMLGCAGYATTKHAARSLAEWLSITYGEAGLHVACLCPQAVETKMLSAANLPKSTNVAAFDGCISADTASESLCKSLEAGNFLALPHPEVATYMRRKAEDVDRWIKGMAASQTKALPFLKSML